MTGELAVVYAIVAMAVLFLLRRAISEVRSTRSGCGSGGCNDCPSGARDTTRDTAIGPASSTM